MHDNFLFHLLLDLYLRFETCVDLIRTWMLLSYKSQLGHIIRVFSWLTLSFLLHLKVSCLSSCLHGIKLVVWRLVCNLQLLVWTERFFTILLLRNGCVRRDRAVIFHLEVVRLLLFLLLCTLIFSMFTLRQLIKFIWCDLGVSISVEKSSCVRSWCRFIDVHHRVR